MGERRAFDVVVIGAGVIGLAVALQLRRAGGQRVVVVDRMPGPGMGSTARANGGVRAQFTTPVNIEFSRFTIESLAQLDERSGGRIGFRRIGYLFLTGTAHGAEALGCAFDLQRSLGVDVAWLSARQALRLAPCIDVDGLTGATFCAGDGIVDPHGVATALWRAGRESGCEYLFDAEVSAISHGPGHAIVSCAKERLEADHVVNAAGPAASRVAALAGVDLPVMSIKRNLACTEPVAGIADVLPMCVDVDTGVLIRKEGHGVLIGYSNPGDPPCDDTVFDTAFLDAVAARIGNRFSFLENIAINPRKCWAGLYPETADHHAIIDAPSGEPWFLQCVGFGGHGIMHSLAAGQAVAELIRDGRCTTFDLTPLRLDRFRDTTLMLETAVL